jgi:predicted acyltransferase (DUF342 family)
MADLDHSLIHQARQWITGANVHYVKTWLFCYETSNPDSARRERYEKLLRDFVTSKKLILAARANVDSDRRRLTALAKLQDDRARRAA